MKKRVNVYPYLPVRALKNPIIGNTFNIELCTGEILNCICAKAKVEEILKDGSKVRLNLNNYRHDFNAELKPASKPVENKIPNTTQPPKHEEPKPTKPQVTAPSQSKPNTETKPAETLKPAEQKKEEQATSKPAETLKPAEQKKEENSESK